MLIRFGGAALAMVAGSITGAAQSAGAAMGRMVADVTSPIRADLVPTASWTNAAVASGGVSALAGGLIEQQAGSMLGQSRAGNYLGAGKIAQSTFLSNIESVSRNLQLGDPKTAEMVGTVAGQTAVGGASGTIKLAQQWRLTPRQLAEHKALGMNYANTVFMGLFHRSVMTPDGRMQVIDVNTSLITGNLKLVESKTREQLFSKILDALNKKDFKTAWKLFNEYKHILSKDHVEKLEQLGNHIWSSGTGSTNQNTTTDAQTKEVSRETGGTVNMKVKAPVGGGGSGFDGGVYYNIKSKETVSHKVSHDKQDRDQAEQQFKYLLAAAFTDSVKSSDAKTTGNLYDKVFADEKSYQEAWKLTEQYKELQNLEKSFSINTLPLLVQHWGDKLLAQHPDQYTLYGPNNAYDEAVKQLIEAIHSGDPQRIESVLNDLKAIQNQYSSTIGKNIVKEGEKLKEEVKEKIPQYQQELDEKKEEVLQGFMWPYLPQHLPGVGKLLKDIKILSQVPPDYIRAVITGNTPSLSLNDLFFPPGSNLRQKFIQDTIINRGTPTVFPTPSGNPITSPERYLPYQGFSLPQPKGPQPKGTPIAKK
jgi:hypothetical protein